MSAAVPRATVASALGLPATTDALPPGDLPVERLGTRYLAYLAEHDDSAGAPDAWTGLVMDHLMDEAPDLALAALIAALPHDESELLADPLRDMGARSPAIRAEIERRAADDPRLAAILAAPEGDDT